MQCRQKNENKEKNIDKYNESKYNVVKTSVLEHAKGGRNEKNIGGIVDRNHGIFSDHDSVRKN